MGSNITLCLSDGARKDILRWISHGPTGDIMDLYTTLPWNARCEEVAKLNIDLRNAAISEGVDEALLQSLLQSKLSTPSDKKKAPSLFDLGLLARCGADGTRTRGLRRDRPAL